MSVPIRTIEKLAGASSLLAGAAHGVVAPAHLEEWWGYGLFFLGAGAFQVLFGLALLTEAVNDRDFGPGFQRARRGMFWIGIGVNVAILVLYAITRTVGIPWFGPSAGTVEEIGFIDVIAGFWEVAAIVCLTLLLRRPAAETSA